MKWGFLQIGIALVAALIYGIMGFWFLDMREFGINFTIGESIKQTLSFLSLAGDTGIVPRTRHARWFLDSLNVMTVTAMAYALFAVFRPVVYRFKTLPHERKLAEEITARYGRSSLDFFKYWPDKTFFFLKTGTVISPFESEAVALWHWETLLVRRKKLNRLSKDSLNIVRITTGG